jgi:hypothetical protein
VPATKMNESEAEKTKARRAVRWLYFLMFAFIVGPLLLFFYLR